MYQTNVSPNVPPPLPSGRWRRIFSFPAVLTTALAFLVFIFSRRNIPDPDLWWHLRNAQFLLTQHRFPVTDTYSFSAPGAPVMPFEWLSGLAYYGAYQWGGQFALFWLVFLLSTAIMLGVFLLSYLASRDVKNSFVASVGGTMLAAVTIAARPLLFGWLYLVILLLILAGVREGRSKWLGLLPPLFCLWINSHGSWPMGMVVLGIFVASGLVEGQWGHAYATRWSAPQLRKLLIASGASILALFLNPFGYRFVIYPFQIMFAHGTGLGIGNIAEFNSVDFHTPWGKVAMVLILSMLLVAIFSQERWRLDEIGFTMVALYFGLTHIRFLFLAGILLPPIYARRFKLMAPYEPETDRRWRNAVAMAVLLVLFFVNVPWNGKFKELVPYPKDAVAYMKANGIHSHVFNEWVWGGYLIWYMPESKVFVDGRVDPYVATPVFDDFLTAIGGVYPQSVLDKYDIQFVLMPPDSRLVETLKHDPAWSVLYSDKVSVLLGRSARS
jgi:hypothetical protein